MEVHHHTSSPGKKSHWRHYVYEFFMLFLAVTLGFFVENQREHILEKKREKEYVRAFTEDLKKDIFQLDSLIQKRNTRKIYIDSIITILQLPDPDLYGNALYFYSRYLPRPFNFFNNNSTIEQLKNSGNLRLITNQLVVDTIMAYDRQSRFVAGISAREEALIQRIFPYLTKLFDPIAFDKMNLYDIEFVRPAGNPHLRSKDKELIENFMSEVHYLKTINVGHIGWFIKQVARAKVTLAFLQKEYHLPS